MEKIKLDLVPSGKMPSLHASQYDDGREHGIDLFENGVVYKLDGTETLTINERKGDDCICSLDIENTFTGSNHIVFASTEQMCAVWGNNICELVIAKGEKTIGTLNFILEIEQSPTEGGIESESEIKNLERQVEAITEEVIGNNYYTAEETDEVIATATEGKADKTYVDTELAKKADKTNTYTKTQVDNALNNKMDKENPTGTGSFSLNRKSGTTVGFDSVAMGGRFPEASGDYSIALGDDAMARGENSFSVGKARSEGRYSVAIGNGVIAQGDNQIVIGKNNIVDTENKYVEIVGNGLYSLVGMLSNARTLDWQGNETLAGDLTYNGNKSITSEIQRLDGRIDDLPEAMVFKGTLGVGGTVEALPTASAENEGWTFKCITAGTYAGLTLKVGDTVTCFNPPNTSTYYWDKTGSQDTDTDTWRNIKVNGTEELGSGISSGSVDFVGSENIDVEFDSNGNKVEVKTKNIYTESEVDDIVSNAIYNVLPDDTASGSVANFETDLALPIKSLEVDVNAVQDLHGYSKPWIGGAGKNKFDKNATDTSNGYVANKAIYSNGEQVDSSANNTSEYIPVKSGATYTLSGCSGWNPGLCFYDENKTYISGESYGGVANKTFTTPNNAKYIRFSIVIANIDTTQLEEGSTATSFEPYSNICPITGFSQANVFRTGTNLWDEEWEVGTFDTSTGEKQVYANYWRSKNKIEVAPDTTYFCFSSNDHIYCYTYDINQQYIGYFRIGRNKSFTTGATVHYINIVDISRNDKTGYPVSINYPSTDTAYHAYHGNTYLIQFGDTYYGGEIDVVHGKLSVTHQYKDLGSFTWVSETSAVSGLFRTLLTNCKWQSVMLCSAYKYSSVIEYNQMNDLEIALTNSESLPILRCRNVAYDTYTATQFKNAVTGVQLVYELATPIEVQLTPQEIEAIVGTNNIWADTGDCAVEFKVSVEQYVEKKIASVQALALNT